MPRRSHNIKRRFEGRCIDCDSHAEFGKLRCEACLMEQRLQKREKRGRGGKSKLVKFD